MGQLIPVAYQLADGNSFMVRAAEGQGHKTLGVYSATFHINTEAHLDFPQG